VLALSTGVTGAAQQSAGMFEDPTRGDLSAEELAALQALVADYGFIDLANLWIESRLRGVSAASRPDLEWIRDVDIPRLQGDIDGADSANQALAKKYPAHRRAKAAQLEAVQASMAKVMVISRNAIYETDSSVRAQMTAERERIYKSEVLAELESNIARLEADVKKEPGNDAKVSERDRWEHYRLLAMQNYARLLPEGSAEAKSVLEKLAELAQRFVDLRDSNFGLQYEAQLIFGQTLGALGRSQEAAEALELLIEVEPLSPPPWDADMVRIFRLLRIQALQGSAEAWNRAGRSEKAVELFDSIAKVPQPHFPWHMEPEDPEVLPFVVSMDVEEAIARLSGGVRQQGIDKLRKLIQRFDAPAYRKGNPEAAEAFLLEVARGLARALDAGVADLPAELYHRAAVGYKAEGRYDDAIRAATLALDAGSGIPGDEYWLAASLYEIGEAYDSLDLPEAAALAYQTLSLDYLAKKSTPPFDTLLPDGSQNWYALAEELAEGEGGPWGEIVKVAEEVFGELSSGEAGITLRLQKAAEAEDRAQYDEARRLYLAIPRESEVDGRMKKVAAYFRARAGAARCAFRAAVAEGRAEEGLTALIAEVEPLIAEAHAEKDAAGEAALRFELANAHWTEPMRHRAPALAALAPLLGGVAGQNPFREGGLLLWVSVLAWGNPEDPTDGPRPAEAEPVLAALKAEFAESASLAIALYELVEANQAVGTPAALERAADLALEYTRHPVAQFADAGPGVKLTLARILVEGGEHEEARRILAEAERAAGDDPLLRTLIVNEYARAGNAAGRHQEVLESLDPFIGENETAVTTGEMEEGPNLLYQRAMALVGLYEKERKPELLVRAEGDLENAVGILLQRRSSLIRGGGLTPQFEGVYWGTYLQYLLVLRAQDRCEAVVGTIRGERIKKGGAAFAPPALQAKFDQLEKDCQ